MCVVLWVLWLRVVGLWIGLFVCVCCFVGALVLVLMPFIMENTEIQAGKIASLKLSLPHLWRRGQDFQDIQNYSPSRKNCFVEAVCAIQAGFEYKTSRTTSSQSLLQPPFKTACLARLQLQLASDEQILTSTSSQRSSDTNCRRTLLELPSV